MTNNPLNDEIAQIKKKEREMLCRNVDVIENCCLTSPVNAERDIAWTLNYAIEHYSHEDRNPERDGRYHYYLSPRGCAVGLAIMCRDRKVEEYLPETIRNYAFRWRENGRDVENWIRAQKEIASSLPIAQTGGHELPWEEHPKRSPNASYIKLVLDDLSSKIEN